MKSHDSLPVSVSSVIYNQNREILLLSLDGRSKWQCVGGWLEQETIPEGILREIAEELGSVTVRLMDILDAHIFHYQGSSRIVSIFALVKYIDGQISPDDDVRGYTFRWWSESELPHLDIESPQQLEILEKAIFVLTEYEQHPDLPFLKEKWNNVT